MEKMKQLFASACGFFIIIGIIIGIVAVVGFPLELFAKAFPEAMLSLGRPSLQDARILFVLLDLLSTIFSMAIVDYFMDSVSTTFVSVLIIGLIIAITSVKDIGKSKS